MPKRAEPLPKPCTPDTMTPEYIVAKFTDALKQFELIYGQPSGINITRIQEVVAQLPLQIIYDKMGGTYNLISLIRPGAAYTTRYGADFAEPTRVGAYDATINDDVTAVVCAHKEAAHKAKRADRGTYETARRETAQFILTVVKDTWVRGLLDTDTFHTDVAPKAILSHPQSGCTGRHALDLLALHNEMQCYHLEV